MMRKRNSVTLLFSIIVVGMAGWLWGHSPEASEPISDVNKSKEGAMSLAAGTVAANPVDSSPPIDALAPEVFETASFGLG